MKITKAEKQDNSIIWAKSLIDTCRRQGYYGKLILHIEDGTPMRIEKNQSLVPPPP